MARKSAVLLVLAVSTLAGLIFTLQTWVVFRFSEVSLNGEGNAGLPVTGAELSQLSVALLLAILALTAVVGISGRRLRAILLALVVIVGSLTLVTVTLALSSPIAASQTRLTEQTGLAGVETLSQQLTSVEITPLPYLTLGADAAVTLVALFGLAVHSRWTSSGRRYEVGRQEKIAAEKPDRIDDWDSLSQGDDPSAR